MIRSVIFSVLVSFIPWSALAQAPADAQRWKAVFRTIAEKNEPKLMVGDIDGFVAAIRSAVNDTDWVSQLVAGDAVYRASPLAAIPFHEAAAKLAAGEGMPQLELAFDYQRTGHCDRAIPAWEAADRLGVLTSPATAVAAYCFFRVGKIDEALALWSRVQWPRHRVSLDFALSEMAMGSLALEVHTKAYAEARAGDEKALGKLIENALDWRKDWWNTGVNPAALDAARELAKTIRPADVRLHRELDCASESSTAKDSASLLDVLRRHRFLIEDGELPKSSEVAKFLFARIDAMKAAPLGDLLDRHRSSLETRARSEDGDVAALEILAFLQAQARDYAGLKRSDELGWRRYHLAKFAASRLMSALNDKQEWSTRGETLLKEAIKDFPEQALLHKLRYEMFPPLPSERDRYLMEWLFAEYAGLSRSLSGIGIPTSTTLASVVLTLRKRREERLSPGSDRLAPT